MIRFLWRFSVWLFQLLVWIDQGAAVLLRGAYYVLFAGTCPNPDETISSFVGKQAVSGKRWAQIVEQIINALFWIWEADHCRKRMELDEHDVDWPYPI